MAHTKSVIASLYDDFAILFRERMSFTRLSESTPVLEKYRMCVIGTTPRSATVAPSELISVYFSGSYADNVASPAEMHKINITSHANEEYHKTSIKYEHMSVPNTNCFTLCQHTSVAVYHRKQRSKIQKISPTIICHATVGILLDEQVISKDVGNATAIVQCGSNKEFLNGETYGTQHELGWFHH